MIKNANDSKVDEVDAKSVPCAGGGWKNGVAGAAGGGKARAAKAKAEPLLNGAA